MLSNTIAVFHRWPLIFVLNILGKNQRFIFFAGGTSKGKEHAEPSNLAEEHRKFIE